ncbi:NADH-quinone oxidoreductase subunit NuoE [Magnetofaba australis]|uniref:Putative NADH-quinone oxidoreductase subunit E n=1 Tax=Magnetofaba australis IT-1 TaxID=1434232 RepID=A0A1Y2K9T4_9PROT|nr:NADH-quinone oxidoreductase subunit NuoE [Magnetofaba australis]OSM06220.1 putative NADH-quinone oxidoreductase subunit E [Magnetofaba australis IT-1]
MNNAPISTGQAVQFSADALKQAETIFNRYPPEHKLSALLPLLDLAQREFGGWLSQEAMDYVATLVDAAPIRVYEVATFYTMYNLKPVGKYHVQICTNISCWLCGSDAISAAVKEKLELQFGQSSEDGRFTLTEVECLGACVNAPMLQINDDYYENLTPESVVGVIDGLA